MRCSGLCFLLSFPGFLRLGADLIGCLLFIYILVYVCFMSLGNDCYYFGLLILMACFVCGLRVVCVPLVGFWVFTFTARCFRAW